MADRLEKPAQASARGSQAQPAEGRAEGQARAAPRISLDTRLTRASAMFCSVLKGGKKGGDS